MRALTVRQPWAGAIVHGGKDVENRSRNIAGSYRGPIAIHVALRHDYESVEEFIEIAGGLDEHAVYGYGAFIGVADLVSVHHNSDHGPHRCSRWAQYATWHLMLGNPRPLEVPIPARGMLGLWTPPADLFEQLQAVAS